MVPDKGRLLELNSSGYALRIQRPRHYGYITMRRDITNNTIYRYYIPPLSRRLMVITREKFLRCFLSRHSNGHVYGYCCNLLYTQYYSRCNGMVCVGIDRWPRVCMSPSADWSTHSADTVANYSLGELNMGKEPRTRNRNATNCNLLPSLILLSI